LPFFLGEVYFYRRIVEAIGYFESSLEERVDPYTVPKQDSLQKVLEAEKQPLHKLEANARDTLIELLYGSLWGNREDLSQLFHSQPESDEMTNLEARLSKLDLAIFKGDANYRRLVGDLHWDHATPFDSIVSYFPSPLVALRTLKSELMAGLQPGQRDNLQNQDPNWLTNARWGIVQSFWIIC